MFRDPVTEPAAVGVNKTLTVQLVAATRTEGQLLVWENTPDVAILKPLMGLPPKFVTVIVWGRLVLLTFCEKASEEGLKLIAEGRGAGSGAGVAPKT
jgi:hypothetical protein